MKAKKVLSLLAIILIAGMLLTGFFGMVVQAEETLEEELIIESRTEEPETALLMEEEKWYTEIAINEVVSGELTEDNLIDNYLVHVEEAGRLYIRPISYSSEVPPHVEIPRLVYGGGRMSETHYFDMKAGDYILVISNSAKNIGVYSFVLEFESAHEGDVVHKNIDFDTLYYGQIDQQEFEHYNCYYFDMEEDGVVDIELASWVPENDHGADQYLPYLKYELKEHDPYHDKSPIIDRFLDKQYYDRLFLKKGSYYIAVSTWNGNFTIKVSLCNCEPKKIETDKDRYLYPLDNKIITNVTYSDGVVLQNCTNINTFSYNNAYQYKAVQWKSNKTDVANAPEKYVLETGKTGTAELTAYASGNASVKTSCKITVCYNDVQNEEKYYFDPVYWALEKGIAGGNSSTNKFNVTGNCTRLQMITMLWKLAGSPKADASLADKFPDVTRDTGKTAIAWGVKTGVIKGFFDGTFRPDDPVTRKQTMIMLYRFAGSPKVKGTLKFKDCNYKTSSDAYKAILWGTKNKITNGKTATEFGPDVNCTRAQIVTFIYRYAN